MFPAGKRLEEEVSISLDVKQNKKGAMYTDQN